MKKNKTTTILIFVCLLLISFVLHPQTINAEYGSTCSEYGVMAYEDYSGYCKCMSGYVFQDNYLGKQCVLADSVCRDDYGIMSQYNSLTNKCECSYGYVLGKDSIGRIQCISDSSACQNQLGYNSRATYGGQCECNYGYVINNGSCKDGNQVCHSDHGFNSSYNNLSNKCECDDEYTFDENYQCVEKQHNVYFKLLNINPEDDKELIIKSDYDSRKYIVRVGPGCLSTFIEKYIGKNIIVNLGTDYEVDIFDTIVLQNESQICSIMHKEQTFDDSFPEPKQETFDYTPPIKTHTSPTTNYVKEPNNVPISKTIVETTHIEKNNKNSVQKKNTPNNTIDKPNTSETKNSIFKQILNFFRNLF